MTMDYCDNMFSSDNKVKRNELKYIKVPINQKNGKKQPKVDVMES